MSETNFAAVDEYIAELLVEDDPAKRQACLRSMSRPIKASS